MKFVGHDQLLLDRCLQVRSQHGSASGQIEMLLQEVAELHVAQAAVEERDARLKGLGQVHKQIYFLSFF